MATWTQRTHLLLRSILFQLRASLWTLGWLWGRHLGLLGRATAEPERRKSFAKAASRNGFYCTANSQGQHGRNKITWLLSTNYRVTPCSTQTDQGQYGERVTIYRYQSLGKVCGYARGRYRGTKLTCGPDFHYIIIRIFSDPCALYM